MAFKNCLINSKMKNSIIKPLKPKDNLDKNLTEAHLCLSKIPETLDQRLLIRLQLVQITSWG